MTKTKVRIGLLLIALMVIIVGFVYVVYYLEDNEMKDGTLVRRYAPVKYETCYKDEVNIV